MEQFTDWRELMNVPISPDDGRVFLLAIGLGAIMGAMFGGWIMTALHKLLMALVKMALLGAVVVIGILIWNGYQTSNRPQYIPAASSYHDSPRTLPIYNSTYETPSVASPSDRWWEQ